MNVHRRTLETVQADTPNCGALGPARCARERNHDGAHADEVGIQWHDLSGRHARNDTPPDWLADLCAALGLASVEGVAGAQIDASGTIHPATIHQAIEAVRRLRERLRAYETMRGLVRRAIDMETKSK